MSVGGTSRPIRRDTRGWDKGAPEFGSYDSYVRAEWQLFAANPQREISARGAVRGLHITRVLDIGCGAGQELRPFLHDAQRLGVGVDISPEVGRSGRELFTREQPESHVVFVRAAAESLPFRSATVDLVICRLALPYTDNARALAEIARVLRPGGALLLKFHHARFYVRELIAGLVRLRIKSMVHASRVLLAGAIYHIAGLQPRGWLMGTEVFQTMTLIRRELKRNGLEIQRLLDDSNPVTPSLVILRAHSKAAVGCAFGSLPSKR